MSLHAQQIRVDDLRREITDHLQRLESKVSQLGEGDEAQATRMYGALRDLADSENLKPAAPTQSIPVIHPRADTLPDEHDEHGSSAELEQVTIALKQVKEDLQRFAYAASHDLQAPLRTINTYLQLLERRLGDRLRAEEREMLGFARSAATRMHKLILDLLLYSRASTETINFELVDWEELLGAVTRELRTPIKETVAEITWDRPLPALFVDGPAILQILYSLIDNAIKYRRDEAPRIHVSVSREANHWRVCVRDNGQGIPPEHTKRIFEMSQRLHGDEVPGSGLGLTICQRLIDRLGGKIWVDSVVDRGSIFCFTIPVAAA